MVGWDQCKYWLNKHTPRLCSLHTHTEAIESAVTRAGYFVTRLEMRLYDTEKVDDVKGQ